VTDKWTVYNDDYGYFQLAPYRVRSQYLSEPWRVISPYAHINERFRTHAEAIAFADRMARDPEAELRNEVGT